MMSSLVLGDRERIVAWLRSGGSIGGDDMVARTIADAIERGDDIMPSLCRTPTLGEMVAKWFASGNPRWVSQVDGYCGGGACFTYEVDGPPGLFFDSVEQGGTADMGHVSYDEEYSGWVANYGSATSGGDEVMFNDLEVALFETVEEAKEAVEKSTPEWCADHFRGMAECTVETLDEECGYFRDLLLPSGKDAAVNELLRRFLKSGGP